MKIPIQNEMSHFQSQFFQFDFVECLVQPGDLKA